MKHSVPSKVPASIGLRVGRTFGLVPGDVGLVVEDAFVQLAQAPEVRLDDVGDLVLVLTDGHAEISRIGESRHREKQLLQNQGVYSFRDIKFVTFFRPLYDQFATIRGVYYAYL